MVRTKYPWETYVKSMITRYPEFERDLALCKEPSLVPPPDNVGHSTRISRPTEAAALRELPPTKQRQYEAVNLALRQTANLPDGDLRTELIDLIYWQQRYKLHGAAMKIGISPRTAVRWHSSFIRLVGFYFGLLEEEDWGKW